MMGRKQADAGGVDVRGQIKVSLGDADYLLRPSYAAIAAIEKTLGRSLMELAQQALSGVLSIADLAIICAEMMRAHGRADPTAGPSYKGVQSERLAELIFEASPPAITARVAVVLMGAVTGGYTAAGEPKPAT